MLNYKNIRLNTDVLILLVLIIYFMFPTQNSSLDAYYYAGCVKYNEDLFLPHHLLYNFFIWIFTFLPFDIDTLPLAIKINSVWSVINLLILKRILIKLGVQDKTSILYVLLVAFSFNYWRYSIENETYIIPVTFSLLGSFFVLKAFDSNKALHFFYSGFFAGLACLFHQIHFFWWLSLFIGVVVYNKNAKNIIAYLLPALLVPLAYILVYIFYYQHNIDAFGIWEFTFRELYKGSAELKFSLEGGFFMVINTIRMIIEVHYPSILNLIKKNIWLITPAFLMLVLLILVIRALFKGNLLRRKNNVVHPAVKVHLLALILQFIFVFYSESNIEFMVMIPLLIALGLMPTFNFNHKILKLTVAVLFIWNLVYSIYPNYKYNHFNDKILVNFIIKHPNDVFVVKNQVVKTMYFYNTGKSGDNISYSKKIQSEQMLLELISKHKEIYTDVIGKPKAYNRMEFFKYSLSEKSFEKYHTLEILNYTGLYGESKVYKVF